MIAPTRRARIVLALVLVHLAVIGGFAAHAAVTPRAKPSEQRDQGSLASIVKLYTLLTAFHADYGFFSPAIGSSHELEIEVTYPSDEMRLFTLDPANREVEIRFHTLLLIFARDRVYEELMARSLAAAAFDANPDATRISVAVYRLQFPTMAAYRAGRRSERILYFRGVYDTGASAPPTPGAPR